MQVTKPLSLEGRLNLRTHRGEESDGLTSGLIDSLRSQLEAGPTRAVTSCGCGGRGRFCTPTAIW